MDNISKIKGKIKGKIIELQRQCNQLFTNVDVKGYQSSGKFNLLDTKENHLFNINPNALSSDKLKQYYLFLEFIKNQIDSMLDEYKKNNGKIVNYYVFDEQYREQIRLCAEEYDNLYVNRRTYKPLKTTLNKKEKEQYPYFIEELLKKSRKILYERNELQYGIKNILGQNDEEFLDTIKKRLAGLEKCSTEEDILERKEYYEAEHSNLKTKIEELDKMPMISAKDKIKEICKTIKWGTKDYYYHKNNEFNLEEFKSWVEQNPNELEYLKTFLPEDCFTHTPDLINWENIGKLASSHNRTYRQYIFGYSEDIAKYSKFKQFYELFNMDFSNSWKPCDMIVLWNMISNLFFNRCAISNNDVLFPVRFVIPIKDFTKVDESTNKFNIRKTGLINPFIEDDLSFIGFITLKYYYEPLKQFRYWILFLFKNSSRDKELYLDYYSGSIPEILILSYKFEYINRGSLQSRNAVTYEELRDFLQRQEQKQVHFYLSDTEPYNIMFLSPNDYNQYTLERFKKINLVKIKMEIDLDKHYFTYHKILSAQYGGSNKDLMLVPTFKTSIIDLFDTNMITDSGVYDEYFKICMKINEYDDNQVYSATSKIYKYNLVSYDEIYYSFLNKNFAKKLSPITKYMPLNDKYYSLAEVITKFNILEHIKHTDSILNIGYNLTVLELLQNNNYKIKNITCIIPNSKDNYYKYVNEEWKKKITAINALFSMKFIYNQNSIKDLKELISQIHQKNQKNQNNIDKCKLVVYTIYSMDDKLYNYENYFNILNLFLGVLYGLFYTKIDGIFIMHFGSVIYKHNADIYLYLSQFFEENHLYYPEINNKAKKTGVMGIFKGFKGINDEELNKLFDMISIIEPYGNIDYYKNADTNSIKHISSFLDILEIKKQSLKNNSYARNNIYNEIINFNNKIYIDKLIFVQKLLRLLSLPEFEKNLETKLPTPDQITSSILYCRKWDIPFWDKYSTSKMDSYIIRNILSEMYGLAEPILYRFKTPYKTHISDKIILNPRFSSARSKSHRSSSILLSVHSHRQSAHTLDKKTKKHLQESISLGMFLRSSSTPSCHKSTRKFVRKSTHKPSRKSSRKSSFKRMNISLLEPLFPSNNQLVQVGRLIDSRRDFTKPMKKPNADYDPQTWLYDKLKWQFRYYKGQGASRKTPNLDTIVQERLGDRSISQAWLKMYEIITDCELIPRNQKGAYRSFHLCEAPGTFINALNNYIRTKTSYTDFEWVAQSLHPRLADIKDTYGLIKRHPTRWNWGADGTGDITQVKNIRHYMKLAREMGSIQLMTSDCGLPMGNPKYELVAFASYVALLAILPRGGTMVYKILSPIDLPLIWNLIYITYTNFKELAFFKPVQNSQSREFYIIAKDYLGTEPQVIDKLLDIISRWSRLESSGYKAEWLEELDLFRDIYPEEFVAQVLAISEKLASNYVNSIERIIYYVDNNDLLDSHYTRHIDKYIKEKNEDWLDRYRPRKLENRWIL